MNNTQHSNVRVVQYISCAAMYMRSGHGESREIEMSRQFGCDFNG